MEVFLPAGIKPGTVAPNYTAWKIRLWKQISADAKTKEAFPDDHFDPAGLLKSSKRPNQELSSWLTSLTNPSKSEGFVPSWEHKGNGLWELYLQATEESAEWVHVQPMGEQKARIIRPATRYKLPRGGIAIPGLLPEPVDEYAFCDTEEDDFVDVGANCECTK